MDRTGDLPFPAPVSVIVPIQDMVRTQTSAIMFHVIKKD